MSQHLSVTLSPETRQQLLAITRKGNAPARVQNRARILLLADKSPNEPKTQEQIAQMLSVCRATVGKARQSPLGALLSFVAVLFKKGTNRLYTKSLDRAKPRKSRELWKRS